MSIDGFLTFVGLILALLALASDATRRRLLLHWRSLALGSAVALPVALYLQLFDVVGRPCPDAAACGVLGLGGEGRLGAEEAGYLVVLAWLVFVVWRTWPRRLGARHLADLAGLLNALAEEKRFGELCRIAGPELDLVEAVASGKVPRASAKQQAAAQVVQRLMHRRENLVRYIALERPRLAVDMMARRHALVFDFADEVLTILVSTPGSPLFAEVADNQATAGAGYAYPAHNVYLHYFFADAERARYLGVWQPVMEATIDALREAGGSGYADRLNGAVGRFSEHGCWKDPTFLGIRFLDLMVSAALVQGVRDHMWLFYTPHVLKPLLALYDERQSGVNPIAETPTRAAWLIQELFAMQLRWIESVVRLPAGSPHLILESTRPVSEPANIPKSAILALTDCLELLLTADRVPERFKRHISDMVFRSVRDLPGEGPRVGFRETFVGALVQLDDHREPYLLALREALADFDPGLQDGVMDLRAALNRVFPPWPPMR